MTHRLLRHQAAAIFRAALRAADPHEAVMRYLARRDYSRFRHVYVIGAGKAGASMARAAERALGRIVTGGLVNVKYGHVAKLRRIELNECGHPVPDQRGAAGAERIAEIASAAGVGDLVLCLISGGASALLPLPAPPITLAEKQEVTRLLLACGADIHEINAVRKHLSAIKGGRLARLAWPAKVEALLVSDVIGDNPDVIGSGPAAPDPSTFLEAAAVLDRYGIRDKVPAAVRVRIEQGVAAAIDETPKPGDRLFARIRNTVIGGNRLALAAAARHARQLGFRTLVLSSSIAGETREIARTQPSRAKWRNQAGRRSRPPASSPAAKPPSRCAATGSAGATRNSRWRRRSISRDSTTWWCSAPVPMAPMDPPTRPVPSPTEIRSAASRTPAAIWTPTIPIITSKHWATW